MSIEIRMASSGICNHGPHALDAPRTECQHWAECDWGQVMSEGRPDLDDVGPLVLVPRNWALQTVNEAVIYPRRPDDHGRARYQRYRVDNRNGRLFIHTDWPVYDRGQGVRAGDGSEKPPTPMQSWTWELFDAHWWDGRGPEIYIGRWPD